MVYGTMLSSEDKRLMKNLRESKRFSARIQYSSWNTITKIENKTLDNFLRKLRTTSWIEHTAKSRRPRSSQTADIVAATEDTAKTKS